MKKIFLCLLGVLTVVGQGEAGRLRYWPGYIDNSDCSGSKDCGFAVNVFSDDGVFWSGEIPEVTSMSIRLIGNDGTGNRATHSLRPYFALQLGPIATNQNQGTDPKFGVYLKDGMGNDTNYRLKGFKSSPEVAVKIRAHLCSVVKDTNTGIKSCDKETRFVDYEYTFEDLKDGVYKSNHKLNNWEAVKWVEVWMQNNKDFRLASNTSGFGVRSLHLPYILIYGRYTTYDRDGNVIADAFDKGASSRYLLLDKKVRLNHRQCKLSLTPDKPVNFGNLSVTDDQEGQIGITKDTQIHLSCDGVYSENLFTGGYIPDPAVDFEESKDISGKNAVHVVEEMKITATTPVMINSEKKIGLTLEKSSTLDNSAQAVPNPNIYVEGSLTKTPFCGTKNKPLPLDVNLKQYSLVQGFENKGEPDNAIGPRHINTFYWKLCKKNGEVEGGKYKGSATISIKYK